MKKYREMNVLFSRELFTTVYWIGMGQNTTEKLIETYPFGNEPRSEENYFHKVGIRNGREPEKQFEQLPYLSRQSLANRIHVLTRKDVGFIKKVLLRDIDPSFKQETAGRPPVAYIINWTAISSEFFRWLHEKDPSFKAEWGMESLFDFLQKKVAGKTFAQTKKTIRAKKKEELRLAKKGKQMTLDRLKSFYQPQPFPFNAARTFNDLFEQMRYWGKEKIEAVKKSNGA